MQRRRRVKQTDVLETRLASEAIRLREQAKSMKAGPAREQLLRRARQCETGAKMSEWLRSTGLQPPNKNDAPSEGFVQHNRFSDPHADG